MDLADLGLPACRRLSVRVRSAFVVWPRGRRTTPQSPPIATIGWDGRSLSRSATCWPSWTTPSVTMRTIQARVGTDGFAAPELFIDAHQATAAAEFRPDGLAPGGLAGPPAFAEPGDQEQTAAVLVVGACAAHVGCRVAGVRDLADEASVVDETQLDGPLPAADGVGDQLADDQFGDEDGVGRPPPRLRLANGFLALLGRPIMIGRPNDCPGVRRSATRRYGPGPASGSVRVPWGCPRR